MLGSLAHAPLEPFTFFMVNALEGSNGVMHCVLFMIEFEFEF